MARTVALALLFASAALAGCAQTPQAAQIPATRDLTLPLTFGYNATGCQEAMLLLLLPKDELQGHLPEGFVAADATRLVDAGIPGGAANRGVLFANAYTCAASDLANETVQEGQVAILVEAPAVDGERAASVFDFYELARVTSSASQLELFAALGWPAVNGTAVASMSGQGGTGVVEQEGALAWSMELTLPGSQALQGIGRFWHAPEGGLAYVDYHVDATQLLGGAQCDIVDGSLLANYAGFSSCTPDNAMGSGFAGFDPRFELTWLPNATVG